VNTVTIDADLPSRLLAVLRSLTATPGLDYARPPEPMSGGYWADLLAFSLADPPAGWPRDLVARVMPDPGLACKEMIIQSAVATAGFPTPAVRAFGDAEAGLGRAFIVMDYAKGAPVLPSLNGIGTVTTALRLFRRMPHVLASSMAMLHALDPEPIRARLDQGQYVPVTLDGLLASLAVMAAGYARDDLCAAARWLGDHRPSSAPDVMCHGDLHPFNLLADGDRFTLVDWSAAVLAPRAYDLGFTTLALCEPPVLVPRALRPLMRSAGRALARRFTGCYQRFANTTVQTGHIRWNQGVVALRALVEVAGWEHDGSTGTHAGHPWLICGPAFARRLSGLTGIAVSAGGLHQRLS